MLLARVTTPRRRSSIIPASRECHTTTHTHTHRLHNRNMSALPPVASIEGAVLRARDGTQIAAKELWQARPAFIYCVRRPGCVLCRDEAQKLWAEHAQLEGAGMRVVCVVHEWIDREVEAFVPEFWGGELYHDVDKALFKAFGNGSLRTASVLSLLNPFSAVWGRIAEAKRNVKESNLSGEGTILGGLLVVTKECGIVWAHEERSFGEFAPTDAVVDAAKQAIGGAGGK